MRQFYGEFFYLPHRNTFDMVTKFISARINFLNEFLEKLQTSFLTRCTQSIVEVAKMFEDSDSLNFFSFS